MNKGVDEMKKFNCVVETRTGVAVIACVEVTAKTEAAAKAKVRRMPKVYPNDMIYCYEI